MSTDEDIEIVREEESETARIARAAASPSTRAPRTDGFWVKGQPRPPRSEEHNVPTAALAKPIRGDDRDLWERQPDETAGNYAYFEYYLRQDPQARSYASTSKAFKVSTAWTNILGNRWSWKARVAAWDAHCARARRAEDMKEVMEMRAAQKRAGRRMREIGFKELEKIEKKLAAGKDLTPNETRLMIDAGFKHEAAALGQADAPSEVQHKFDGINVEKLTEEQLRRIVVDGEDPAKVLATEMNAFDEMQLH